MRELRWQASHIGTTDDSTRLINEYGWSLTCTQEGAHWLVRSGEKVLLRTDSKDTLDAFIYGMALAYSILPGATAADLRSQYE